MEVEKLEEIKFCNNCFHLSYNESTQNELKSIGINVSHFCKKHKKIVKHLGEPIRIHPCSECNGNNYLDAKIYECDGCGKIIKVPIDYQPEFCCSGLSCGCSCLGKPINPVFCDECESKIVNKVDD